MCEKDNLYMIWLEHNVLNHSEVHHPESEWFMQKLTSGRSFEPHDLSAGTLESPISLLGPDLPDDLLEDIHGIRHNLRTEFREEIVVQRISDPFRCRDVAAEDDVAQTGAAPSGETLHHHVVDPVRTQLVPLNQRIIVSVQETEDHQSTCARATYIALPHPAAETGTQLQCLGFGDTALVCECRQNGL